MWILTPLTASYSLLWKEMVDVITLASNCRSCRSTGSKPCWILMNICCTLCWGYNLFMAAKFAISQHVRKRHDVCQILRFNWRGKGASCWPFNGLAKYCVFFQCNAVEKKRRIKTPHEEFSLSIVRVCLVRQ